MKNFFTTLKIGILFISFFFFSYSFVGGACETTTVNILGTTPMWENIIVTHPCCGSVKLCDYGGTQTSCKGQECREWDVDVT